MHFSFYCVISHAFLISFSSILKRTSLRSKMYPCTAQFLVTGILFLYPRNFQLFFSFERPESLAILPDLPKPIYLSLPISPLVLHRLESFSSILSRPTRSKNIIHMTKTLKQLHCTSFYMTCRLTIMKKDAMQQTSKVPVSLEPAKLAFYHVVICT